MLIERETLGGGVGVGDDEFDDDWAMTVARKPNPRRTAARGREWGRPTMAGVAGGRGSHLKGNA